MHRTAYTLLTISGAQLLLHRLPGSLRQIRGLDIFLDANQGLLQRIERGRVQHLLFDLQAEIGLSVSVNKGKAGLLTLAVSGHHDMRKSFCFFELSVVPWHWCIYSKSNRPYLQVDGMMGKLEEGSIELAFYSIQ